MKFLKASKVSGDHKKAHVNMIMGFNKLGLPEMPASDDGYIID